MPKALHKKLSKQASKKGLSGKKKTGYGYGAMAKVDKRKAKKGTSGIGKSRCRGSTATY